MAPQWLPNLKKKMVLILTVVVLLIHWTLLLWEMFMLRRYGLAFLKSWTLSVPFVFSLVANILFLSGLVLKKEKFLLPLIYIKKFWTFFFSIVAVAYIALFAVSLVEFLCGDHVWDQFTEIFLNGLKSVVGLLALAGFNFACAYVLGNFMDLKKKEEEEKTDGKVYFVANTTSTENLCDMA